MENKMTCSASSLESQSSTLINKEEMEISTMGSDTLSAEQFANAVGLQVESFNDVNPELSILSVMTSKDKDIPSTSAIPYSYTITTSSVGMSYSFPKLDMNIFIPPPEYTQFSPDILQPLTISNLSSTSTSPLQAKSMQRRRASEASYFNPIRSHQRTTSTPDFQKTEVERIDEDIIRVLKKGRFTMTVERSAQWTSRSQRRRTSSRFSLQSPSSSLQSPSSSLLSPNSTLTTQFERQDDNVSTAQSTVEPSLEKNDHVQSGQITKALIASDDRRDSGVDSV